MTHLARAGERHGDHRGDLPSQLVSKDGTDDFANVPLGGDPDEYSANSSAAVTKTTTTGNAGDRYVCGVISLKR